MRDFTDDIAELRRRLGDAEQYLRIEDLRHRRPQLETEASRPDLWDDPEVAKKVNAELAAATDDIEMYEGLTQQVDDADTLAEQARCARLEGAFVCPEGAAALAAVRTLRKDGWISEQDEVVVLNTGSRLKYSDLGAA